MKPLLPHSCLFDIPDDYKTTIDGKRFLLADETVVRRERILMYSSDHQLDVLFNSPIIYMDGTFSKSPAHFSQIYIIHAILFDICKQRNSYFKTNLFILGLPCVFCLLVNKKAVTYRHIFSELKQIAKDRGKVFWET
jgi:hypothetical protein